MGCRELDISDCFIFSTEKDHFAAHFEYSPFGKIISENGSMPEKFAFRFSSEYHDSETGLVYYNYRYYSPELGRWINRDPIGEDGGNNLYGFVGNSPINFLDKLGLAWKFTFERESDITMISNGTHMSIEGEVDGEVLQGWNFQPKNFCGTYGKCERKAKVYNDGLDLTAYMGTKFKPFRKKYGKGASRLQPSGELRYKVFLSGGKKGDTVVVKIQWDATALSSVSHLNAGSFYIRPNSAVLECDNVSVRAGTDYQKGEVEGCFEYQEKVLIAEVEVGVQYQDFGKFSTSNPYQSIRGQAKFSAKP